MKNLNKIFLNEFGHLKIYKFELNLFDVFFHNSIKFIDILHIDLGQHQGSLFYFETDKNENSKQLQILYSKSIYWSKK